MIAGITKIGNILTVLNRDQLHSFMHTPQKSKIQKFKLVKQHQALSWEQTRTMIISPDSCPDASRKICHSWRLWQWPSGCSSMAVPPPSCHPAHSLSSMALIVLGRGGPFLLTSLVLLFLQGPALRTWNCCETLDVTRDTASSDCPKLHASLPPQRAAILGRLKTKTVPGGTDARRKGVQWRRGLCLLGTGRALFVSIALFSLLWGCNFHTTPYPLPI